MKAKVSRVLLALFMIVTLLTQIIPFQAITAYAESTNTTQKQESDNKTKSIESTREVPVGATSESIEESSKNDSSQEVTTSSKTPEEKASVASEEVEPEAEEDKDLDGSIYGSGAGVPGEQVLFRSARALSADLPTFFGISAQAITNELEAHQSDGFYLGTPYRGLYTNPDEANYLSPNGAPTSYGPGMNCTGFVATVIKRAGGDISRITNNSTGFGGAANAYNWRDVLRATTYADTFDSIPQMLASGKMLKGDIIFFEPNQAITNYDAHIGFFWGNTPSENKFWHSYDPGGNMISEIKEKTPSEKIYVFHNTPPEVGKVQIKKVDDTGKAIAGAEFDLIAEGKTTKATTNSNGELSTPDYNVGTVVEFEETKAPAGHYIDPATSKGSVTLKEGTNTIKVTNPRFANLTLVKKDDKGQKIEGAKFNLTYDGKTHEVVSAKDGTMVVKGLKAGTKVDWEEVATVAGHYIDPAHAKGSIVVKSGENTINVNNPTLNFGLDSQASNTDGEKFVNPAKDQELREEVMIEAHQAPANAKLRLTTDFVEFGTGKELGKESLKQVTEFEAIQARFVKTVNLNFDATGMHGKKGVFTNVLHYFNTSTNEWEEVARHDDLNNEDEAIQIVEPKIHTEFFFYDQNGNESKLSDPLAKVKGFDRTHYENLISDKEYKFDLALMNKDGETPFTNPDGKEVTGTLTVIAGKDGVVTSKVDAKEYYENLAKEEAEKEDSKGSEDTKEETQGKEKSDIKPLSEEGQEEATDEEEAPEVQTEFSEVKPVELLTGYVDVPFEANSSVANGKVVVAYEQLSTNETPIAEHKDPDSEEQTGKIRNPEISTTALVNGEKEVTTDGKIVFEDETEYKDLTPGVEYEMDMTVMVKDENAPLNLQDKEVTGKGTFTPEKENGKTTVKVEFEAKDLFSKYGDSVELVAFEKLSSNGEVIAVHEDINDKGQTVKINKPGTPIKSSRTVGTLPQTSGTLGNPFVWVAIVLAIAAGAIFVFMNKKRQDQND